MANRKKYNPTALYFPECIQEKLKYIQDYPLSIIHAPAGFGKTTALNHFCSNFVSKLTTVFYHTFLSSHISKNWQDIYKMIEHVDKKCAKEIRNIGIPNDDNLTLLAEAVENLECESETYMILDSFELSGLEKPERFLTVLSRHGSETLHIIVVTRELSSEYILFSNRIYLMNAQDFVFSIENTEAYFKLVGLEVSHTQIELINHTTGGWILVLYMQIMAYIKNGSFSNVGTMQLIQQVVWDALSESYKDFFMSVSIMTGFTLVQAVSISGIPAEQTERMLLEHAFVNFDEESGSYYMHTIFAAFLKDKFNQLPEEKQKIIYLKGGDLVYKSGNRVDTIRFYYHSGVWERLFALPLNSYELADVIDEETRPMIIDVMKNTSYELKSKYPAALVPLAFTLFFLNENAMLISMKDEIEGIIQFSDMTQRKKDCLLGEMELLFSFMEYNRIDAMSEKHRAALKLINGPATLINPKSTWTFGSPSILYLYWRESGKLNEELEQMDECMPIYYQLANGHGTGAEHIMRAEALFYGGDMDQAEILCHRALFDSESKNQNSIYLCGLFLLSKIAVFRGNEVMLHNLVKSIQEWSKLNMEDLCRDTQDLILGFLNATMNYDTKVATWLAEGDITGKRLVIMTQPFAHIIYGRCLLNKKDYKLLIGACEHLLGLSSIFPNLLPQVYAYIYIAHATNALGNRLKAIEALKEALKIALPDCIYMPFAENYNGIKDLFSEIIIKDREQKEAIGIIGKLANQLHQSLFHLREETIKLTERESVIYELVKEGYDNKAISEELGIKLSTIRNHLSRMYEKAGVTNKAQLILLNL